MVGQRDRAAEIACNWQPLDSKDPEWQAKVWQRAKAIRDGMDEPERRSRWNGIDDQDPLDPPRHQPLSELLPMAKATLQAEPIAPIDWMSAKEVIAYIRAKHGAKFSLSAVCKWAKYGVGGVKLKYRVFIGQRQYSAHQVDEFIAATSKDITT